MPPAHLASKIRWEIWVPSPTAPASRLEVKRRQSYCEGWDTETRRDPDGERMGLYIGGAHWPANGVWIRTIIKAGTANPLSARLQPLPDSRFGRENQIARGSIS